jgi:hypothetical protein
LLLELFFKHSASSCCRTKKKCWLGSCCGLRACGVTKTYTLQVHVSPAPRLRICQNKRRVTGSIMSACEARISKKDAVDLWVSKSVFQERCRGGGEHNHCSVMKVPAGERERASERVKLSGVRLQISFSTRGGNAALSTKTKHHTDYIAWWCACSSPKPSGVSWMLCSGGLARRLMSNTESSGETGRWEG